MPQLKLNTTTSIVDFLKNKGLPSDFPSRNKLFRESGLETTLGSYVGSPSQNTNFLRHLNIKDNTTLTPPPLSSSPQVGSLIPGGGGLRYEQADIENLRSGEGTTFNPPVSEPISLPQSPSPIIPSEITSPITAVGTLAQFGIPATSTAEDITKQVFERPEFQLAQERKQAKDISEISSAEAKKQELKAKYESDRIQLEDTLGRRGLFMSGIRTSQVKLLTENLAASQLGVDRKLAETLLESDYNLRQKILDSISTVVQQARQGRQDAIGHLEAAGLTVIGDKIVPTLAAQKADEAQIRSEKSREAQQKRFEISQAATEERFRASQETSQARFEVGQAAIEERFNRVQARLEADEGVSKADKKALGYDKIKTEAAKDLLAIAGSSTDRFTDPDKYAQYRAAITNVAPLYADDFDKAFSVLLNPSDAARLGIVQDDPMEVVRQQLFRQVK